MKYLIVFAAVLAFAAGEGEFDSANVRPIDDFPFFQATIPQFKRNTIDGSGTGSRINGGNMADLEDFPYLVSLRINILGNFTVWCGGTILSENYVLTAALCIDTTTISVEIIFGRNTPGQISQTVEASDFIIHPEWNRNLLKNDIALIPLNDPLTFTPGVIEAVTLPSRDQEAELFLEDTVRVPGFGTGAASALRYSTLEVINNAQCMLSFPALIDISNFCGISTNGVPCTGDAGGPVVITDDTDPENPRDILIGIASYGQIGCPINGRYVFTRFPYFFDFIEASSNIVIQDSSPIVPDVPVPPGPGDSDENQ